MTIHEETGLLYSLGTEPPTEILLFRFGENDTKKGKFVLDQAGAEAVLADFVDSGMDSLPFDIAHGMVRPKNQDSHKASGWFIPVITSEGLAATDISWTKAATEMIEAREMRFYSPAIKYEGETRRIVKLTNVALTNLPATKNQTPLVLDALGAETEITKESQNMKALLDSLGVNDEASAVAKVGEIKLAAVDAQALLSAVEADSVSDAVKAIEALKVSAVEAQAQLSAIATERAVEKRSLAIETLSADGKLLDSQKEFAAQLSDELFDTFSSSLVANKVLTGKAIEDAALDATKTQVPGSTFNADDYLELT